ncbi:MAG: hypothetical protein IIA61_08035 [Candidatus Marinimicrobia bacterium]|nr:hypothetical protein [Candidatus Neomarinimicrobiota bacterium]
MEKFRDDNMTTTRTSGDESLWDKVSPWESPEESIVTFVQTRRDGEIPRLTMCSVGQACLSVDRPV